MPSDTTSTQTQQQVQVITLNVKNSGDPALEADILGQVHSAGRQLSRMAAVVEVLLEAGAGNPVFEKADAAEALAKFRSMQQDIARAKGRFDPERYIERLEALRSEDTTAFDAAVTRLRAWLDGVGPVPAQV